MRVFFLDPPSVYDLIATSLNETSIELVWSVPQLASGIFNSLNVKCFLNDDFEGILKTKTFNESISDKNVENFIVTNLIPGAFYNCFVTTIRKSEELSTRTDSKIAACLTSNRKFYFILLKRYPKSSIIRTFKIHNALYENLSAYIRFTVNAHTFL